MQDKFKVTTDGLEHTTTKIMSKDEVERKINFLNMRISNLNDMITTANSEKSELESYYNKMN